VPSVLIFPPPRKAAVPAEVGALYSPAAFLMFAVGNPLSFAQLISAYPIAPTFPLTPAATNADPDAPWKLKNVEMLLGVELANVPLAVFGQSLSFAPAFAPFRN